MTKDIKQAPKRITIRKLIVFLVFLSVFFFVFKPNPPIEAPRGAVIRLSKDDELHKFKQPTGINQIIVNLDNKRINRINQRRDAKLINKFPTYFGQNSAFKPLLELKVQGPVNIEIKGDGPTETILFHVPDTPATGEYNVEVYPHYNLNKLFSGSPGDIETITISQWKPRGLKQHVDTIKKQWSGPNDLFLSTRNLMDIASLIKEFSKDAYNFDIKGKNIENFTQNLGENIKSKDIRYETELAYLEGDDRGWQLIRTPIQIEKDKKANCIDIAILTSIKAIQNGFKPYIWANSGHALCAISYQSQNATQAIAFEGTDYLKAPLKPPTIPGEVPREYLPEEEIIYPEREPPRGIEPKKDEIFSMDYNFWEQFYRTIPKDKKN